jgi:PE family
MALRVVPDIVASAAAKMDDIGSTISSANTKAASPTASIEAAAADDVSAAVAATFGQHAQGYQDIGAQMERFHAQFVKAMTATAATYAESEAANATQVRSSLGSGIVATVMNGLPMGGGVSMPNVNVGSLLGGLSSPNLTSLQGLLTLPSLGTVPSVQTVPGLLSPAAPAALVRPLAGNEVSALPSSVASSGAARVLLNNASAGAVGAITDSPAPTGTGSTSGLLWGSAGARGLGGLAMAANTGLEATGGKALLFGGAPSAAAGAPSLAAGISAGQSGTGSAIPGADGLLFAPQGAGG